MLDANEDAFAYEAHALWIASERFGQPDSSAFAPPFQLRQMRYDFFNQQDEKHQHTGYMKFDRLNLKLNFARTDIRVGRQAVSWGVGRFWQPLDVFGAFNATELIRDYKPGIDVINASYYPDDFSHINVIYAASTNSDDNLGLRYSRPIGKSIYTSFIVANILSNRIVGASIESEVFDAGVYAEGIFSYDAHNMQHVFAIAGLEYQFDNEWLLTTEYYYNSRGADRTAALLPIVNTQFYQTGLVKQLSEQLAGLSLVKTVAPLLTVNYLWLSSLLGVAENYSLADYSSLHQFTAIYSTSNESDLRFSVTMATGQKADTHGIIRSEFGHIPLTAGFLYRLYF